MTSHSRHPQLLKLLGQAGALRKAGLVTDSLQFMRRAASLAPGDAVIHHDLGLTLLECGRAADAEIVLRRAVTLKPDFAQAQWRLGIALDQQANHVAAMESYRTAVALLPSLVQARFRLAELLEAYGHRTEAIALFKRLAAATTKTTTSRLAEARELLARQRDTEAERAIRRALVFDADNGTLHEVLGNILADTGRFAEAERSFSKAVALNPGLAGCAYDLVRCRTFGLADLPLLARLVEALRLPTLEPEQRVKLHLAIGKVHQDLGEFGEAMRAYDAADAVRQTLVAYREDIFRASVDRIIARFTPAMLADAATSGRPQSTSQSPRPVLVFGMPRSGTTLVEQIISSHPAAAAAGELHFWTRRGAMSDRIEEFALPLTFLDEAASSYREILLEIGPDAQFVTDKMPLNFLWAGLIHLTFPNAALIHCRRNPVATALSIHQTFFSARLNFPTGGEALVGYYRHYERLMAHWRAVLPADRWLDVSYESLAETPEPVIRQIIGATGLAWDDACLYPERNERVIKTPSKWQARQPIFQVAIERWRRYEPWLGPLRALDPAAPSNPT